MVAFVPAPGQLPLIQFVESDDHPRTTKNCRCAHREHCDHSWVNADEGAGEVVKSTGKMYWAHKASLAGPGIPAAFQAFCQGDGPPGQARARLAH